MTLADAIKIICEHVISNLNDLTVNRVHSRNRQDLRIDNGAGAWILLSGDTVSMSHGGTIGSNDGIVDRLYFGADKQCWIERNPNNGNLTFHTAPGRSIEFDRGTGL